MLPGAAAWVINGLKMSLPYALIGVIVGEFLIASSGLGYRLNFYSTSCNTNGTFAMTLVMMALMMVSVPKTKFDDNLDDEKAA